MNNMERIIAEVHAQVDRHREINGQEPVDWQNPPRCDLKTGPSWIARFKKPLTMTARAVYRRAWDAKRKLRTMAAASGK